MDKPNTYEVVCKFKEIDPVNLNEKFTSYGCGTLEAKVPIVEEGIAKSIQLINDTDQVNYTALTLKARSARNSVNNKRPPTAHREVKLVDVNGHLLLAAGPIREKSPVSREQLDDDIEEYMKDRPTTTANSTTGEFSGIIMTRSQHSRAVHVSDDDVEMAEENRSENQEEEPDRKKRNSGPEEEPNKEVIVKDTLDEELDSYMKEAARRRAQRRTLQQHVDMQNCDMDDF